MSCQLYLLSIFCNCTLFPFLAPFPYIRSYLTCILKIIWSLIKFIIFPPCIFPEVSQNPPKYPTCVCAKSLQSCLTLCDLMDCNPPGSSVHGFSRQKYWSGFPCPPPGDLPDPGIKPMSLMSPVLAGRLFLPLVPP